MATSSSLETSIGRTICSDSGKDLVPTFDHSTEIDNHSTASPSPVSLYECRLLQRKISLLEQDLAFLDSSRDQMRLDHSKVLITLQSDQRTALALIQDVQTQIQIKTDRIRTLETGHEASTQSILHQRQKTAQLRRQKQALWESNLWLKDEIQRKEEEESVILSRLAAIQSYCEKRTVDDAQIFELEKELARELERGVELSKDTEFIRSENQILVEDLETLLVMFKEAAPAILPSCSIDLGDKKYTVESSCSAEMYHQSRQCTQGKPQRLEVTSSRTIESLSRSYVQHHHHSKTNSWLWQLARWTCIFFFYSLRVVVKVLVLSTAAFFKMAKKVFWYSFVAYVAGFISWPILKSSGFMSWLMSAFLEFILFQCKFYK